MVRSLAVYSLQRVAKLEPARVKPILMTIIENIAERPEVCPWFLIKKAIWYVSETTNRGQRQLLENE